MSFPTLGKLMLRRWYLTLIGIAATVALAFGATILVPVTYQATADVLLLPPSGTGADAGGNPFLGMGGLQPLVDVVARATSDPAVVTKLRDRGVTGTYTATRDETTDGPILLVTADGTSAAATIATLNQVVATIGPTLRKLQENESVRSKSMAVTKVITRPANAVTVSNSQKRALLVAIVGGLVGTVLFVAAADGIAKRRKSPEGARPVSPADDEDRELRAPGDVLDREPVTATRRGRHPRRADDAVAGSALHRAGDRVAVSVPQRRD